MGITALLSGFNDSEDGEDHGDRGVVVVVPFPLLLLTEWLVVVFVFEEAKLFDELHNTSCEA